MRYEMNILLVGTGAMAIEYLKVLCDLPVSFQVVGRSDTGCNTFFEKTGYSPKVGGIQKYLEGDKVNLPDYAIIAVSADQLKLVTLSLLNSGVKNILVEKPAGLTLDEIKEVFEASEKHAANVYVAYNRRHYASTQEALRIIAEDGGVVSCNFEFTERSHIIRTLNHSQSIRDNWLFANSTHVIDLALFVAGHPTEHISYSRRTVDWSRCPAVFGGAGITDNDVVFTYNANWLSPGNWKVEWLTLKHRIILNPLETIQIQTIGLSETISVPIDNQVDTKYKPGLFVQVRGFLGLDAAAAKRLKSISEQYNDAIFYSDILNSDS